MEEIITRLVTDLIGRITGPVTFRLLLQPGVAFYLAFRDAREGGPRT